MPKLNTEDAESLTGQMWGEGNAAAEKTQTD